MVQVRNRGAEANMKVRRMWDRFVLPVVGVMGLMGALLISMSLIVGKFGSVSAYSTSYMEPLKRQGMLMEMLVENWGLMLVAGIGLLFFMWVFAYRKFMR